MDCKQALTEANGDIEEAKDWLRKKGLAGAGKRAGRAAEQGAIEVVVDGGVGALVELTAETDFVAKSAEFTETVSKLAQLAAKEKPDNLGSTAFDGSTVEEHVTQLASKLGENVALGRVAIFDSGDGLIDGYKHVQSDRGTIGVLVELTGVDPKDDKAKEVAHELALHISFAAPRWLSRDEVPSDVLEKERAVLEELTRNEGKPDNAIPKIVEGRLNGFYKENVLLDQPSVRDAKVTVGKLLEGLGKDATVSRFARVKIGEDSE
jgi:elongation factor Ts